MNPLTIPLPSIPATDEDLAEQARPGHGIPSQDPDSAAQLPLDTQEAEREAQSALTGGGVVAGAATGAAIGGVVGGPVGIVVGVALGAVAGALGGSAVAAASADAPDGADAVHLHVEDSGGDGRAVLLIHGWPLSVQAWEPQQAALRQAGYRVVAYGPQGLWPI